MGSVLDAVHTGYNIFCCSRRRFRGSNLLDCNVWHSSGNYHKASIQHGSGVLDGSNLHCCFAVPVVIRREKEVLIYFNPISLLQILIISGILFALNSKVRETLSFPILTYGISDD